MKINFNQKILDINNKVILQDSQLKQKTMLLQNNTKRTTTEEEMLSILIENEKDNEINLEYACTNALLGTYDSEKNLSADKKLSRYLLAVKIKKNKIIDLKVEEVTLIKELLAKAWSTWMFGFCCDLLEKSAVEKQDEEKD